MKNANFSDSSVPHGSIPRKTSGARVQVHYLPQQGFHFTPTELTEKAADRFGKFMESVISSPLSTTPLEPEALVASCAVAFELLNYKDLPEFLEKLNQAKTYGNFTYASWHTNGQLDRRAISGFTLIALSKLTATVDWKTTVPKVMPAVLNLYDFGDLPKPAQTLKSVFLDMQAWIYLQMPMPFLSHHLGCVQATPLPETAWQRRFQLHTPPVSHQEARATAELTEETGVVMETYQETAPILSGAWYLEELASLCKGLSGSNVSMRDSTVWKELMRRFRSLSYSLRDAGPNEAVLTGWAMFVAKLGTLRKKNPRLSRLAGYLSAATKRLHAALRGTGRHPADLSSKEWDQLFRDVLALDPNNNTLRAALASFHLYLCVTFDSEPIGWLHKSLERSQRPRANCIWPHEIARLPDAIDRSTGDLRLRDQVKTWAQLLTSAQIRFGELKWIRHKDIIEFEDHIQIHLANQPYVGSGKTPAADRLVFIRNPDAIQVLKDWLVRPEFKSADRGCFIFAAPDNPRNIYKLGKGYALLTRCLKEVTGCNDFSIHLCRHTCISLALEQALFLMVEFHEINPIHEVQVQSGHQSPETTWRTYFHLMEDAMRYWHDRALRRLTIRSRAAAWWSDRSDFNLRQDKHRGKE
ncbi:site-specific integrase [Rhodoferax lacus]|nr:site-specific integrase [Rhodoferax lacus]